ncbi:MAG: chromate resistance protein [Deltaproteobacteria bacterium]|nr:chromate resistance protein [Deltaproteobacteria bacterium]
MKWITRSHVHVDRVACPWLITRFIDSDARFLFVPKKRVLEIAEKEGAVAFDTPGAELHHRDALCTFDVIIKEFELTDPALLRMARVINAADTNRLNADPLAAGFEAIAVGFGLRYPDDQENLERQFEVYDALYAWCRLDVAGSGSKG